MKFKQIKQPVSNKNTGLSIGQTPARKERDCTFRALSIVLGISKEETKLEYKKLCPNSRGRGVRVDLIKSLLERYGFQLKYGYLDVHKRPTLFHSSCIKEKIKELKTGILITSRHATAFKDGFYYDTHDWLNEDRYFGVRGYFFKT